MAKKEKLKLINEKPKVVKLKVPISDYNGVSYQDDGDGYQRFEASVSKYNRMTPLKFFSMIRESLDLMEKEIQGLPKDPEPKQWWQFWK